MTVINTNVKALYTQAAMQKSAREMTAAMQQLSTGKRINSGKDDAAGLAIAARMTQQIRSLNMAVRNAGDAITLIQTAEGATGEMTDMIQRMRELAIQAINDTNNNEQRSYLDLEFQQLKQEIVRIAETTEWNGFSVLDGSAGYAIGERPVYKTTSVGVNSSIFVDPTTVRTMTGNNSGETQSITFTTPDAAGTLEFTLPDGTVSVEVTATDVASGDGITVAAKVVAALNSISTRTYTAALDPDDDEKVNIYYNQEEEDPAIVTIDNSDNVYTSAPTPATDFTRLETPTETFGGGDGKFLQSGALTVTVDSADGGAAATATFTNNAGEELSLYVEYDETLGTMTFPQSQTGYNNSAVLSNELVYTFSDGTDNDLEGTYSSRPNRDYTFSVAVNGSVPAMATGDLIINGVTINQTLTGDDTLSPANNALGSSIAKAAAINRHSAETGVYAVVNETVMAGAAQSGTSVVSGRVVINGVTSPTISTVMNNQSQSRAAVVAAINLITEETSVRAYDTGTADEGIRLVAADGRNIELTFDTAYPTADFSARTGLREGVQAGTYSLETSVEGAMVITTDEDGLITNSGLKIGDFTENVSAVSSNARAAVASGGTPVALQSGDLVMNGVAIRGARSADDTLTQTEALTTTSNTKASSAIALAAAINASTAETGVTAVPNPAQIEGDTTTINGSNVSGEQSLWINGVEVAVNFTVDSTGDTETRLERVVEALAASFGEHGVVGTKNTMGGLTLSTTDGRNLSVWVPTGLTAAEFGLTYDGDEATGVTLEADVADIADATTVFGGVTLKSNAPITIEPGASGYTSDSNFRALGFLEGTFGGVVDESESKMTPPRTGRLTFHVGPSAGQTITIDLADFGKGGPITSEITGDVDLGDSNARINRIDSVASAQDMLAKLDSSIDKVNATRARMGVVMNRLEHVIDNLMNVSMNTEASRSKIEDADYAAASTQLARTQIMQQASTAVLAQANASQQGVLKLLQ